MNLYNFGSPLTQANTKAANRVFVPGVYSGFEHTILGPNQLSLASGVLMSPKRVLWAPETTIVAPAFPVTSTASEYTLQATHDDVQTTGGSSFQLRWVAGIQPRYDAVENAVSILYVRQPVGGALQEGQITHPLLPREPTFSVGPDWVRFSEVLGSNVQAVRTRIGSALGVLFTNTAGVGAQVAAFSVPVPPVRGHRVRLRANIPSLASVLLTGYCEDGSMVGIGSAVGTTTIAAETAIPVAINVSPMVLLEVAVTIPAGSSVFLNTLNVDVD